MVSPRQGMVTMVTGVRLERHLVTLWCVACLCPYQFHFYVSLSWTFGSPAGVTCTPIIARDLGYRVVSPCVTLVTQRQTPPDTVGGVCAAGEANEIEKHWHYERLLSLYITTLGRDIVCVVLVMIVTMCHSPLHSLIATACVTCVTQRNLCSCPLHSP